MKLVCQDKGEQLKSIFSAPVLPSPPSSFGNEMHIVLPR